MRFLLLHVAILEINLSFNSPPIGCGRPDRMPTPLLNSAELDHRLRENSYLKFLFNGAWTFKTEGS